jgi:hypothetical protein
VSGATWFRRALLIGAVAMTCPGIAHAQAWTAPKGAGSVSFVYQQVENTGHKLTDGFLIPDGKSRNVTFYVEADYALTDRFSVSLGLPFVLARFIGPNPGPFGYPAVDACKCWQRGWQDISTTARYNLSSGAFGLTPSVSFGLPSHDYNYIGEAVVGRRLREMRLALDAGYRLDAVWDRLVVQGRYSYAVVERVLDVPNNRSNAQLEGVVLLSRRASIRGTVAWQRTHGGLRAGSLPPFVPTIPGDVNTPDRVREHDRLLRDNYSHVGGSVAYAFPSFDVFGSYRHFAGGTDTHAGRSVTVGVSWPFEWRPGSNVKPPTP